MVCRIQCDENKKFSQPVPEFYTCGAEGFWRPNPNTDPRAPFVYPACSEAKPAQKIFKIKLQYLTSVLCNDAGQGVLRNKIITALQELNKEWRFATCDKITQEDCEGLNININCIDKNRLRRQADLSPENYGITITLPVVDGEEVTSQDGRRARLEELINNLINKDNKFDVDDLISGTFPDRGSVELEQSFKCESGSVVVDSSCVPCAAGTFYDEQSSECVKCPLGQYSTQQSQTACTRCPDKNGRASITETTGSKSR